MEHSITEQIPIEELQKLFGSGETWTGYLWQDDKSEPFVFPQDANNIDCNIDFSVNIPFIIEGFLVKKDQTTSLTIKNIDGVYYCYKSKGFAGLGNVQTFPAVDMIKNQGIEALQFIPIFKKQRDPLSPDFQEYVYSHQIFKGILS